MKRPELPKKIVRYKIAKSKIRLVTKRRSSKTARASDSTKKNV
jgi:hypothetical protein